MYSDDGYTGTNFNRPDFKRMIKDVKSGKINCILVNDLSRFGREHSKMARYTDFILPSHNCGFVSKNESVDTIRDDNDIMYLKNVFNEMYAHDVSKKVKAVKLNSALKGDYVAGKTPYGYKRNPDDKHKLIVDNEVVSIVKQIFQYRAKGYSYRKIAITLNEQNIPCPSVHKKYNRHGKFWTDSVVKSILTNEAYIGNTVQQKTTYISFKNRKVVHKDESEWVKVENTHEAIIDNDTWEIVQEINSKAYKPRTQNDGDIALFSGLLKCADCGFAMRCRKEKMQKKDNSIHFYRAYSCGSYSNAGKKACSSHWISEKTLIDFVTKEIQELAKMICYDEEKIVEKISSKLNADSQSQQEIDKKNYLNAKNRLSEIAILIQRLYEDNVLHNISSSSYHMLMQKYETEQSELLQQSSILEKKLNNVEENNSNTLRFTKSIKKYMSAEVLTREMLVELVNKIEIGETYILDNQKHRDIKIYYNFIDECVSDIR